MIALKPLNALSNHPYVTTCATHAESVSVMHDDGTFDSFQRAHVGSELDARGSSASTGTRSAE